LFFFGAVAFLSDSARGYFGSGVARLGASLILVLIFFGFPARVMGPCLCSPAYAFSLCFVCIVRGRLGLGSSS
jgi:hypothetical protein